MVFTLNINNREICFWYYDVLFSTTKKFISKNLIFHFRNKSWVTLKHYSRKNYNIFRIYIIHKLKHLLCIFFEQKNSKKAASFRVDSFYIKKQFPWFSIAIKNTKILFFFHLKKDVWIFCKINFCCFAFSYE